MNDITLFNGQKVSAAFRHLNVGRSLGEGIVAGGFPTIRYRAKNWSLRYQGQDYNFLRPDDHTPLTYIDVIILDASPYVSKEYYSEFNEDSTGAPICYSTKGEAGGPDPGVQQPQSKTCATCKLFGWTTLPNGKQGKICRDHKRLAVLLMPALTTAALGSPLMEPVYLKVPPASLKALKTYGDLLTHQGYPSAAVVTRISFSASQLFQMEFRGLQVLTDKEAPLVLPLLDHPQTRRITGEQLDIREIEDTVPVIEDRKPINTGLQEAFGMQPQPPVRPAVSVPPINELMEKRPRGRPRKMDTVGQATLDIIAEPPPAAPTKTAVPWNEDDSDLDRTVADLLSQKTQNMFK